MLGRPVDSAVFDLESTNRGKVPELAMIVADACAEAPQQQRLAKILQMAGPEYGGLGPRARTSLRAVQSVLLDRTRRLKQEMN